MLRHMQYKQLKSGQLRAGLTQKQAVDRLGVSQPYLSQLEKGERLVTPELALSTAALNGKRSATAALKAWAA